LFPHRAFCPIRQIQIFKGTIRISHEIGCLLHDLLAGMDIASKAIKKFYKWAGGLESGLEKGDFLHLPASFSESTLSLPIV
jgi:hypothetical protein